MTSRRPLSVLETILEIDRPPGEFLDSLGVIFKVFGPETQDSGNVSYGIEASGLPFFVKTTDPGATVTLDYDARVELLRNAVRLSRSCDNALLPRLLNVIESPEGPMLVYEWVAGELLRDESARRRFRLLPADDVVTCLGRIFELHAQLAAAGWVAVDFYDGCLIYGFSGRDLHVVDLDHYHLGPFTNSMGRMFGSSRFMAPEEFAHGQLIDERTTVFTMGRAAAVLLSEGTLERAAFRGSQAHYEVMIRACEPLPEDRFESVRQFCEGWMSAG